MKRLAITLKAEQVNGSVVLRWNMTDYENVAAFDIERSRNGSVFEKIGSTTVEPTNSRTVYTYSDNDAPAGNIVYRIKRITAWTPSSYSNVASVNKAAAQSYVLAGNMLSGNARLIVNTKETATTNVVVYNSAGQTVFSKQMILQAGQNYIELPINGGKDKLHIISLFINNKLQFSGKALL